MIESTGAGVTPGQARRRSRAESGNQSGRECEFCLSGEHSLRATFHLLGEHIAGTFAEVVVAPAVNAYPKPAGLSGEESAAFPLTFLTAWRMLVTKARVKPGESLLIVGIGGGVAVAALQIAKLLGLAVFVHLGEPGKTRPRGSARRGRRDRPRQDGLLQGDPQAHGEARRRCRPRFGGEGHVEAVDRGRGQGGAPSSAPPPARIRRPTSGASSGTS